MKERTKSHLAGLIDSDGKLSICRHTKKTGQTYYGVALSVENTYRPLMTYLTANFGGYFQKIKEYRVESNPTWNPCYSWKPSSSIHAAKILSFVSPYLIVKKRRALLCERFFLLNDKIDPIQRKSLYDQYVETCESVTTNTSCISLWTPSITNSYFAGFFDGEGSVGIYKTKQSKHSRGSGFWYKPRVSASNSVRPILKKMQSLYGGGLVSFAPRTENRSWEHSWSLTTNRPIELFLLKVLPYLVVKYEQANTMMQLIRMNGSVDPRKRECLALKLQALKR